MRAVKKAKKPKPMELRSPIWRGIIMCGKGRVTTSHWSGHLQYFGDCNVKVAWPIHRTSETSEGIKPRGGDLPLPAECHHRKVLTSVYPAQADITRRSASAFGAPPPEAHLFHAPTVDPEIQTDPSLPAVSCHQKAMSYGWPVWA